MEREADMGVGLLESEADLKFVFFLKGSDLFRGPESYWTTQKGPR